jgi:hypothetical protein
MGSQETRIRRQESGDKNQEARTKSQEPRVKKRKARTRRQEFEKLSTLTTATRKSRGALFKLFLVLF